MKEQEPKWKTALAAVIDIIWAGMLWLLCSLPVLTIGPASTALYYAVVKSIRHERGSLTKTFFAGFRQNFRQSFPLWLLCLALLLLGGFDLWAYGHLRQGSSPILQAFSGVLLVPVLLMLPWLFPYVSRFDNGFGGTLRFVFFLAMRNLGRTLLLTGELLGFGLIGWLIPQLLPLLPGIFALLTSFSIEPVFRQYTAEQGDAAADQWYNE